MKILYLADINSIHDYKWISYIANEPGFELYLITDTTNYKKVKDTTLETYKNCGVQVLPPIDGFSFARPTKTFISIQSIKKIVTEKKIDVFHVLFGSPDPIWFAFLPKTLQKGITCRGSDVLVLLKGLADSSRLQDKVLLYLLNKGYGKANFITCTSTLQVETLKAIVTKLKVRPELVKTGVDIKGIEQAPPKSSVLGIDGPFIFSARYIGPIYNMGYQLEVFRLLPIAFLSRYTFLFVKRSTDNSAFYHDFIRSLDAIDGLRYHICSDLTQEEMWSTIKSAAVVYMVPKSDGTPNTALECMAAQKPFIMGDLDYNKELFEGVSLVADLGNASSLSTLLQQAVMSYPSNLIAKGYENVKRFGSRSDEMRKLLKIYKGQHV